MCKITKGKFKIKVFYVLILAFVFNVLGTANLSKEVFASTLPKMTSVELVDKNPTEETYPTLKLTSKECDSVQYSVYLYSKEKKTWENVSDGYTKAVPGNSTYTLKLKKPLQEGVNSFSVWVKKAGAAPTNKGGYDDFQSFQVTAKGTSSQQMPKLQSASIDSSEQKAGVVPTLNVVSNGDGKVQYRVYLYSPTKKTWEDVTNGYTEPVDPTSETAIKLKKPLHEGENSFSVWVKRNGKAPSDPGGFDHAIIYRVDAQGTTETPSALPKIKSAKIDPSELMLGNKPTLELTSTGSEEVEYRVYLYSPTKKTWVEVTNGYSSPKNPSVPYKFQSNTALHEGVNSFSVWVKRAGQDPADKGGYDNFLSYNVEVKPSSNPDVLPKINSAKIDPTQQKANIKPVLELTATGTEKVEYRAYLYSPAKKAWVEVSNGYSSAQSPSVPYKLQSNTPLHKGVNSLSIWVKRSGKAPTDKGGYDNFLSYEINVTEESNVMPTIQSVDIEKSEIKLGGQPSIKLKSSCASNVQYSVYLYSQSKGTWANLSNGYTASTQADREFTVNINKPLQPGRNVFSIWVKRNGQSPSDPGGYDSFVQEVVNVDIPTAKTAKLSTININSGKTAVGTKPELTAVASAGDGSNISYKAFLYSNSQGKWIDASNYTSPIKSGNSTTLSLNTPLEAGTNKILVWAKRAWVTGEVYEDYKIVQIDAVKPAPLKKTIVVDPGHGGKDPGTVSPIDGTQEKVIALIVGTKLGNSLKNAGFNVIYTRTDNNNVAWNSLDKNASLKYRYTLANNNGADLYVSVHCNSTIGGFGTETWYSKMYPSKDKAFASSVQNEVIKATGMKNRGIKNTSNFQVVNHTKMPAALVELGFIDSPSDLPKLKDNIYQDKFAKGIHNGINAYLGIK